MQTLLYAWDPGDKIDRDGFMDIRNSHRSIQQHAPGISSAFILFFILSQQAYAAPNNDLIAGIAYSKLEQVKAAVGALQSIEINVDIGQGETYLHRATYRYVENADCLRAAQKNATDPEYANAFRRHPDPCSPILIDLLEPRSRSAFDIVEYLLEAGADPSVKNKRGLTPLLARAHGRNKEFDKALYDLFFKHGAAIETVDSKGNTLLLLAAQDFEPNTPLIEFCLAQNANIDHQNKRGDTALILAAGRQRPDAVGLILAAGAGVHARNSGGMNALHNAVWRKNNLKIIDLLLDAGADLEATDRKGQTPLAVAGKSNNWVVVEHLLMHGANSYVPGRANKSVADNILSDSAIGLSHLITKETYRIGDDEAEIKAGRRNQVSPLASAVLDINYDKVKKYLELGFNPDTQYSGSPRLLHGLSRSWHELEVKESQREELNKHNAGREFQIQRNDKLDEARKIFQLLLEQGADTESRDGIGNTPLIVAAGEGSLVAVKLLLDHGADINAVGNRNTTALIAALEKGKWQLAEYLLDKGADATLGKFDPRNTRPPFYRKSVYDWPLELVLDDYIYLIEQDTGQQLTKFPRGRTELKALKRKFAEGDAMSKEDFIALSLKILNSFPDDYALDLDELGSPYDLILHKLGHVDKNIKEAVFTLPVKFDEKGPWYGKLRYSSGYDRSLVPEQAKSGIALPGT